MPIKFYTDSHIAKAVTTQLRRRSVDIVRCQEVGMDEADDPEQLEYAVAQGRTIITSDEDFLALHALWQASGRIHAGIVYVFPENREAIGLMVRELFFWHEAIEDEAADLEKDVYNQIIRI
jgi:predicted nuclease of predicted toxin-antitoxin system